MNTGWPSPFGVSSWKCELCQHTDDTYTQILKSYPVRASSRTWNDLGPGKTYYFGARTDTATGVTTFFDWMNFFDTHTAP